MTITDLTALSASLATETANVEGITERARQRGLIAAADAAYTAAVQAAVGGSGTWGDVQQAGIVAKQVKAQRTT